MMLSIADCQEMLAHKGYIQDIGQIDKDVRKCLDRSVKRGILFKTREQWLGYMGPLKTTWTLKGGG